MLRVHTDTWLLTVVTMSVWWSLTEPVTSMLVSQLGSQQVKMLVNLNKAALTIIVLPSFCIRLVFVIVIYSFFFTSPHSLDAILYKQGNNTISLNQWSITVDTVTVDKS